MSEKFQSRGPQLDNDLCVAKFGNNRFNMVIGAALRAKEIKRNNKESDRFEHTHPCMTALLEIQEGAVGLEILDKLRKKK